MAQLDAQSQASNCNFAELPEWKRTIIKWLLNDEDHLDQYDKLQIVFNRSGSSVFADWMVKGVKLPQH